MNADDDAPGVTIAQSGGTTQVSESGSTDTFTVVLIMEPTGDVVIDLESNDTSEADVSLAQLTFTSGDWSTPKTVTVTSVDDSIPDGDQISAIVLSMNPILTTDAAYSVIDPADVPVNTTDDDPPVDAPSSFVATATSASQVSLSWGPVFGSTAYELYRAPNLSSSFTLLTTIAGTSHPDLSVGPDTTYLYKVRAINSSGSGPFSTMNTATTVIFSDASLTGVAIKALHLIELRMAIGAMRAAADLSAASYTDPSVFSGATTIKEVHLAEMRAALDAARAPLGLSPLAYTDPLIVSGSTVVKEIHFAELRAGTQ